MRLLILSIFIILNQYLVIGEIPYCYGKDKDKTQKSHFSTKTGYKMVKGPDFGYQFQVGDCVAEKIWILSRHGVRWPSAETMSKLPNLEILHEQIDKNINSRKTQLCPDDIFILRDWHRNPRMTLNNSDTLTSQGREDVTYLAKFFKRGVPKILGQPFNNATKDMYLFRHTSTERTKSSYEAFFYGLFDFQPDEDVKLPPIAENDALLKSYEQCPKWKMQYDKVKEPGSEVDKFENSDIMKEVIQNISRRLGFEYPLERSQIELIWDICRFEEACIPTRNAAWCTALTPNDVSVLEYTEDLKYYYRSGYGNELNSRMACGLVKDMIRHLDGKEKPNAMIYFTHSAAMQLFYTALEVGKDNEALKADNYDKMKNRNWSTSKLGPFSANFAAIKYTCPKDVNTDKVLFLLNQNIVDFNWCNNGLCLWSDIKKRYERFLNNDCPNYFCEISSGGRIQVSIILLISLLMYLRFLH